MKWFRKVALIAVVVFGNIAAAFAGETVLTIVSKSDPTFSKKYDMEALEALGLSTFSTTTTWTDGDVLFEGVKLSTLLDDVKLEGSTLHVIAVNDYAVDIPRSDASDYPVMIATRMNGERMSLRDKGPLWIVYPRNDFPELMDEAHNFKWVWQLGSIEVR
jgi:hypothetical protein